jgi:hypothetical protein
LLSRGRHILLGKGWLIVEYPKQGSSYSFIYDIKNGKPYNLKGGAIKDDIFGSASIQVSNIRLMDDGFFCFTKTASELNPGLTKNLKKAELYLVVMQVKQK